MPSPTSKTLLRASQLDIGYRQKGRNHTVAEGINLELYQGELVCLLGANGIGKSTLIRTLSGMQTPIAGNLKLGEKDFNDFTPRQRARMISVVLTENLSSGMMDVYSLVALGRHPYSGKLGGLNAKDHKRIEWALEAVGAEPLKNRRVSELSDGERQKVAISRALAQETRLMLLDEPTAFLDLPHRIELMTLLRNLTHSSSMGMVLSTHDLDLALKYADRLWVLGKDGRLLTGYPEALGMDGTFAESFSSKDLVWDVEKGSFNTQPNPCLSAEITGNGVAYNWTCQALERLGFGCRAKNANPSIKVEVAETETSVEWTVYADKSAQTFNDISELIDWVQSENWQPSANRL